MKIPEMLQPVSEERDSEFMRELIEAMSQPIPDDGLAHPRLPCFPAQGGER